LSTVSLLGRLGLRTALLFLVACTPAAPPAVPTSAPPPKPAAATAPQGSAAGGDWAQVVEAAKKEKLVIVTMPGANDEKLMALFRKAYPEIPVEHSGIRPSDFSPRLITEQKNGVFAWDAMESTGTSNMNEVLLPADAFQPLPPFLVLPEVLDDSKWGTGKLGLYTSDKGPYILVHNLSLGSNLYINRDVVPESELNTLDGLMDPKFQGKIVAQTCSVPAQGLVTADGISAVKGKEWLRDLFKNQKVVFEQTVRTVSEWVATGRYPIGIGVEPQELKRLGDQGIGKNVVSPFKEIRILSASGVAVFKNAPHPNAAKVFINWFLSREGQLAWEEAYREPVARNSRRLDVPVIDPDTYPDYSNLRGAVWGMDSGYTMNQSVSAICKEFA
jgi:iron(III) transport system substrate-binding protein